MRLRGALPALVLLWLALAPGAAEAQTLDLRNNLKKLSQYLDDGFCDDALALAGRLTRREDGARSFDAHFGVARALKCKHDIAGAFDAVDALQQALSPSPEEAQRLSAFTEGIEGAFAQLRVRLPGEGEGHPRLHIEIVTLDDPELRPFAEGVAKAADEGVPVPGAPLYLPLGTYEIDFSLVRLDSFAGQDFVVGRERPSAWRRSQLGDGQALGVGYVSLVGFQGESLTIDQLSGESQTIVTEERLAQSHALYLSLATTHSFPAGTLGRASVRLDGRLRPALGEGAEAGDPPPFYASLGLFALIQRVEGDWTLQGGVGARGSYLAYYTFIGLIEDGALSEDVAESYRIAVDAPVLLVGPELSLFVGRSFPLGDRGVQIGLEAYGGASVLFPTQTSGELTLSDESFEGAIRYSLITEYTTGTTGGLTVSIRIPLF